MMVLFQCKGPARRVTGNLTYTEKRQRNEREDKGEERAVQNRRGERGEIEEQRPHKSDTERGARYEKYSQSSGRR